MLEVVNQDYYVHQYQYHFSQYFFFLWDKNHARQVMMSLNLEIVVERTLESFTKYQKMFREKY